MRLRRRAFLDAAVAPLADEILRRHGEGLADLRGLRNMHGYSYGVGLTRKHGDKRRALSSSTSDPLRLAMIRVQMTNWLSEDEAELARLEAT
jgi:hypothetical protein